MSRKLSAMMMTALLVFCLMPVSTALAGSSPEALGTTRTSLAGGATYTISSEDELAWLATLVNGGEDCSGNGFVLTVSIMISSDHDALTDGNWTPIGNDAAPFNGSFYGQNHTVIGLSIHAADSSGLFGYIGSGGVVLDLSVWGNSSHAYYIGGIAGQNRGLIQNCSSSVTCINSSSDLYLYYIGGIAGLNSGTVQNCANSGDIHSLNDKTNNEYVGGVVGANFGRVINCTNSGDAEGYAYVGGVAGYSLGSSALICNCFNTGDITGGGASSHGRMKEVKYRTAITLGLFPITFSQPAVLSRVIWALA